MPAKKPTPPTASLDYERAYFAQGYQRIVGLDEAGRGAWAGPVSAAAVSLPLADAHLTTQLAGTRDSKQMTHRQRETLADIIKATAQAWGIGYASHDEIDQIGISAATQLAMSRALGQLLAQTPHFQPDYLFTDHYRWHHPPIDCPQCNITRGDRHSLSIAAASILAKTWRDDYMRTLETQYPGYDFAKHKGYGTAKHRAALASLGVSAIHRQSFAPIRNQINKGGFLL